MIERVADVLAVGVLHEDVPRTRDEHVVRDHVVARVELHEQLDAVGVHDRVVDDDAVLGAPPAPVVAADRDPDRRRVVDEVVARRDVPGGASGVLAGELDPDVHVVDRVALDQDVAAAVDVDAVGAPVVPVRGVAVAVDVPHLVAAHDPVARLVDGRIGRGALEADHVDPDVVRVVHLVALDEEVLHVAVHDQGLGRAQGEVRELVVDDLDLLDRMVAVGAEHPDPVRVAAVAALERRPEVVHDVAGEPDVVGGAGHQDPDGHVPGHVAPVPRDLEPSDRDVALGVDRDHGVLPGGDLERRAVEHDPFVGSRRERDRPAGRPRDPDLDPLLVHALAHEHRRARTHRVRRVLERGPRLVPGPRAAASSPSVATQ